MDEPLVVMRGTEVLQVLPTGAPIVVEGFGTSATDWVEVRPLRLGYRRFAVQEET